MDGVQVSLASGADEARPPAPNRRPSAVDGTTGHGALRRRDRGSFRVVPQGADIDEELYAVVSPAGVTLYTFGDLHEAIAEAAELNKRRIRGRLSSRPEGRR